MAWLFLPENEEIRMPFFINVQSARLYIENIFCFKVKNQNLNLFCAKNAKTNIVPVPVPPSDQGADKYM